MIPYLVLIAITVGISVVDLKERRIPNRAVLAILLLKMLWIALGNIFENNMGNTLQLPLLIGEQSFQTAAIGGGLAIVITSVAYALSKGQLGMGDVKLLVAMAFYLGFGMFVEVLLYSLLSATIYGVAKVLRKKADWKTQVPFAPFVAIGLLVEGGFLWYLNDFALF